MPGTIKARAECSRPTPTPSQFAGTKPIVDGDFVRSGNPATGLGADNRAGCAVLLQTARTILQQKLPHPPLTFCWFIQEEAGLYGAR
ncbi:MAG: M28 family peptidase [Pirellulales bacterium]